MPYARHRNTYNMHQTMFATWIWLGVVGHKVTWMRATLLYPASSVLQLTASISVPVIDLPPQRRIGFDWGIQMNYDMPFNLSAFSNVPIWPTSGRNLTKRAVDSIQFQQKHRFDFDLLDLYKYLEQRFASLGFHKTCLLLGICELAQQTLEWHDLHFFSEILKFLARPSLVSSNSSIQMSAYTLAEVYGLKNENCYNIYDFCDQSPLNLISKLVID